MPCPVLNTSFMRCCVSLPSPSKNHEKRVTSIEGLWAFQHHTRFPDTQSPQGLSSSQSGAKAPRVPHSEAVSLHIHWSRYLNRVFHFPGEHLDQWVTGCSGSQQLITFPQVHPCPFFVEGPLRCVHYCSTDWRTPGSPWFENSARPQAGAPRGPEDPQMGNWEWLSKVWS